MEQSPDERYSDEERPVESSVRRGGQRQCTSYPLPGPVPTTVDESISTVEMGEVVRLINRRLQTVRGHGLSLTLRFGSSCYCLILCDYQ